MLGANLSHRDGLPSGKISERGFSWREQLKSSRPDARLAEFLSRKGALSRLCVQRQGGKILRPIVERQLKAEGDLCAAIYELMVGHRYSVFEVRDAVDPADRRALPERRSSSWGSP